MAVDPVHDLALLIRSHHGLIHIDSDQDERVGSLLRYVAASLDLSFFTWTRVQGLKRVGMDGPVYNT